MVFGEAEPRREDPDGHVNVRPAVTRRDHHRTGNQEQTHGIDGESAQRVVILDHREHALGARLVDLAHRPERAIEYRLV